MSRIDKYAGMEGPPEGSIEMGTDHWYTKMYRADVWIGINEWHIHPITGNLCGGWVPFASWEPTRGWDVVSLEPLTLSPSLLCTMPNCGNHGFIRNGRWESC